jgi:hypothetical protein
MSSSELSLAIFPGHTEQSAEYSNMHKQAYQSWVDLWTSIFTQSGAKFDTNVFLNADRITVISYRGEVISYFLSSFYPLTSSTDVKNNKYFSIFPPSTIEQLRFKKVREVMTFEYLTVLPQWRQKKLGFPLGAVMIGLGLNAMMERGCDASVGVARIDAKVDRVSHEYNAMTLVPEVLRANIACEIVGFFPSEIVQHPDPKIRQIVAQLWAKRTDYSMQNTYAKSA